jgi:hypothetical protein
MLAVQIGSPLQHDFRNSNPRTVSGNGSALCPLLLWALYRVDEILDVRVSGLLPQGRVLAVREYPS